MSKRMTDIEARHADTGITAAGWNGAPNTSLAARVRADWLRARRVEEQAELLRQKEKTIKALANGLRAISMTVGISRRRHLASCVRYGGRMFDEYTSACTAECHDARPALDALEQLP